MAKAFSIIKRENLVTGELCCEGFTWKKEGDEEKETVEKLARKLNTSERVISRYCFDEVLGMHLLPGMSKELVSELSSHVFSYAYAVCKKEGKKETVLYLSLFKDMAMRFKNGIPAASIRFKDRDYANPDYYVKELRIIR
ncbi:MAG: hypothetical protein IJU42_07310 [Erysipelotrichaceae bacterium]|nr:hypothetical protein [Erysipelotrichaceae bacterium]